MPHNGFRWPAKHQARAAAQHLMDVVDETSAGHFDSGAMSAGAALGETLALVMLFRAGGHMPANAGELAVRLRAAADVLSPPKRESEEVARAAE
jgi:hypothetical protein